MLDLAGKRNEILSATGHLLITGGPGSGKTTISILKAQHLVESVLTPGQQVLFLSFARATVARVVESLAELTKGSAAPARRIEIDTYHAFFWRLLRTHGYLLGLPRRLSILTPPDRAIALTAIRQKFGSDRKLSESARAEKRSAENNEQRRLAFESGRVSFDLFSGFTAELVGKSDKLRRLITSRFPAIILDEFQDTNAGQWAVMECLGSGSTLVALADEEQRIYDFAGADPERLNHFRSAFGPTEYDFGTANYRSSGTDIARFGNDVFAGKFTGKYTGVGILRFPENTNQAMAALKGQVLQAIKRLNAAKDRTWSLAILVPTKSFMREVSEALRSGLGGIPAIAHRAAFDMEGAILAAELIALSLQPPTSHGFTDFARALCNFYLGKGGDEPTASDLGEAVAIEKACEKAVGRAKQGKDMPASSLARPLMSGYEACLKVIRTGNPEVDWSAIRHAFETSGCKRLALVAEEARNLRLLERGTHLRDQLSLDWRTNGHYMNALAIVKNAFTQEHFSASVRRESGVIVMNMHKAKGKQFDEVIIFEGWPRYQKKQIVANINRIVRGNCEGDGLAAAKHNLRVSITRARSRTTILTPERDACILLVKAYEAYKNSLDAGAHHIQQ